MKFSNPDAVVTYSKKGILHVGASVGQEKELYGDRRVLWIEPIKICFDTLVNNVKGYKNHKCMNLLITNIDREKRNFNISNQTSRSSMYKFTDHHFSNKRFTHDETIELEGRRLDSLINDGTIDINKYDILVTDCQGGGS